MDRKLIQLHPRSSSPYISRGRIALITDRDGFIRDGEEHGLFAYETRVLSRYRLFVNGEEPTPVALSAVKQHSWLGYYVCPAPGGSSGSPDHGSGMMQPSSEYTLELRVSRSIGTALTERLQLTNYTQQTISFELELQVDADFADIQETGSARKQQGKLSNDWQMTGNARELTFEYSAEHAYNQQGNRGTASIHRGLAVRILESDSQPHCDGGTITFDVELGPRESWRSRLVMDPWLEDGEIDPGGAPPEDEKEMNRRTQIFMNESAVVSAPGQHTLTPVVLDTIEQAREDLGALRLFDFDDDSRSWTMAAGSPIYLALYGRDILTAAWQASMVGPEMMEGSLRTLARWQGREINDWRDEQPGRMPHELHPGPLKVLNYSPNGRNYGSVTPSAFYAVAVSEYWHWTGDEASTREFLAPALRAVEWLDEYGDLDDDGLYEYKTRSNQGVKHQAWKDSPDAIVDHEGNQVDPPIATCEEQGFVYLAKLRLAEVCWWMGERNEARRLYREAKALKQRFNETFWMEEEGCYAMGLDRKNRQIRSIGSNPGHCLATAIADSRRVRTVADRLLSDDMFTGWGIRTLSAQNPAYNPYSYHRGSVWPVEHGTFALGFMRYGLHEQMHQICRAQFEAANLFGNNRLPEVFSGHRRSEEQPFPAFYPQANTPQAWSASAVYAMVQAMLGLYPYAPLNLLLVDPHLPPWLPELRIQKLRVGRARLSIRFYRKENGTTAYEVEGIEGKKLHVVRQPSPWSMTATYGERVKDFLMSLMPDR